MSSSELGVLLEGGVVDEHVEAAERARPSSPRPCRANFASLTSPATSRQRRPSASTQRLRLFGVVVLVRGRRSVDVGALAREQHGDGAADAGIAAGDDRRECPRACRCRGSRAPGTAARARGRPRCRACAGAGPGASRVASARRPARALSSLRSAPLFAWSLRSCAPWICLCLRAVASAASSPGVRHLGRRSACSPQAALAVDWRRLRRARAAGRSRRAASDDERGGDAAAQEKRCSSAEVVAWRDP